jgi:HSP90 family molecular chaperone
VKEGQKDNFYPTGESSQSATQSPFVEVLKKKGYEVLYLVDPIEAGSLRVQRLHPLYLREELLC